MSEDLVRDLLSEQARAVPIDVDLLGAVSVRRRARRTNRLRAVGSGLAVVLVLAAVGVTVGVSHRAPATRNGPSVAAAAPTTYPAGTRPVTWAGIQLDVPASWTSASSDPHRCAAAEAKPGGEVDYAGATASASFACNDASHPVHQHLELGTSYSYQAFADAQAGPPGTAAFAPTTFAGYPAQARRTGWLGQVVTEIRVPRLNTEFTLTTNTPAQTAVILGTAKRVAADENGCAVDESGSFPPLGSGGAGAVLTQPAAGGIACSYVAGRLQSGSTLDAAAAAALTGAFGRLPATYTAAQQRAQRTEPETGPATTVQLTLRDAAGVEQTVTVEYAPAKIGVAGQHSATLTQELAGDLETVLPGGFLQSYAEDVVPAGCVSCTLTTAPPPTRPVTYRGLTFNVPATWVDASSSQCLQPGGYVETITPPPTGAVNCPALRDGQRATLSFSDDRYGVAERYVAPGGSPAAGQPVQLGGMAATVVPIQGGPQQGQFEAVDIPATHAQITAMFTQPTAADVGAPAAIFATARAAAP